MMEHPGTRSFMRFKDFKSVDFPQPEGPMKAVTFLEGISMLMFFSAWKSP